jgi:hypothetical protein
MDGAAVTGTLVRDLSLGSGDWFSLIFGAPERLEAPPSRNVFSPQIAGVTAVRAIAAAPAARIAMRMFMACLLQATVPFGIAARLRGGYAVVLSA